MRMNESRFNGFRRREERRDPTAARPAREGVLEIGAQSLKYHRVRSGGIRTVKFPYELGHEVYATGSISPETVRRLCRLVDENGLHPELVIATSAVRDADNRDTLVQALANVLGVDVHVVTCLEEASLLARAYLAHSERVPALVMDVGGGSVETVFLSRTRTMVWDSLPLGAIQLFQKWKADGMTAMCDWIDVNLRKAAIVSMDELHATGGTVKAVARTLQAASFGGLELEELERSIRRDGPPRRLDETRARVFYPGVVLLRKLIDFVGARRVSYLAVSVGRRALEERLEAVRAISRTLVDSRRVSG